MRALEPGVFGGPLSAAGCVVPASRMAGDRAAGRRVLTAAAGWFGVAGGIAWVVQLATGPGSIDHRGLTVADLPDSEYGRRILAKLVLLIAMGVVSLLHALWQGPRVRCRGGG